MGNVQGPGNFSLPFNSFLVGSGEVSKFFQKKKNYKREDACKRLNFLTGFEFRLREAGGQTAAWPAAASVMPGDVDSQHAAAATVGLEEYAWAGAASEEGNYLHNSDGSGNTGMHDLNYLHDAPNSDGMETDFGLRGAGGAATDLPAATIMDGLGAFPDLHGETNLSGVFSVHAFGGHGGAASVLGDTGSVAFSSDDLLIHDSLANSSYHPIHACAHSCLDGCGEGSGVCDGGCARAPVSFLSSVPGVGDDEDDACMDGNNSLIQGFGCHATACTCLDALQNSRWARGYCLRGGTKCTSTGSGAQVWLSDEIKGFLSHQKPESLHVEMWAGAQGSLPQKGFKVQELEARCVPVSFPSCYSDLTSVLPGPGSEIRRQLGWTQLEKTGGSGMWFFRGAFQGEDLFSSLAVSGDWVKKGSYHTAWSVPGDSLCSCSYAYGHGPAIGPHTGKQCWVLLSWLWRTIAPLMKPWCAEGEVPTAANLNLYRGW